MVHLNAVPHTANIIFQIKGHMIMHDPKPTELIYEANAPSVLGHYILVRNIFSEIWVKPKLHCHGMGQHSHGQKY
jgi:hypothetical protein